jgi:hypothetical protein
VSKTKHGKDFPWGTYTDLGVQKKEYFGNTKLNFGFVVPDHDSASKEVPDFMKELVDSGEYTYVWASGVGGENNYFNFYLQPTDLQSENPWKIYDHYYELSSELLELPGFASKTILPVYSKKPKSATEKLKKAFIAIDVDGKWKKVAEEEIPEEYVEVKSSWMPKKGMPKKVETATPPQVNSTLPGLPVPPKVLDVVEGLKKVATVVALEYGKDKKDQAFYLCTYTPLGKKLPSVYVIDAYTAFCTKSIKLQSLDDVLSMSKVPDIELQARLFYKNPEVSVPGYVEYDDYSSVYKGTCDGKIAYKVYSGVGTVETTIWSMGKKVYDGLTPQASYPLFKPSKGLIFHSTFTL